MKVQLDKSFALEAPAGAAWALLQDLEAVAGCMPGARITERVDATHYKGTVTVKLGPASLVFRGEVERREADEAGRTLELAGRGTDSTGTSGATLELRARVTPVDAGHCVLAGTSQVSVSGKAAAFGGRLMSAVADQLLQQFAANFAERLRSVPVPAEAGSVGTDADATVPPAAAPAQRQLNGLALLWSVFRDWLHDLFPAKRA